MEKYMSIFSAILLGAEFISALVAVFYFKKTKNIAWQAFAFYLIFIFLQEFYFYFNDDLFGMSKKMYYGFIGMPLQMIFFYWLIAFHSLKNERLFYLFVGVYLPTIPIDYFLNENEVIFSLSFTIGTLLLFFLVVMEFIKQIKSDEILNFKQNKMFYIMVGVTLAYIGTYPFNAFREELFSYSKTVGYSYYFYFIISSSVMYLLFAASFIWGKRQS